MIESGWYLASKIFVSGAIVYSCMRLGRSVDEMLLDYLKTATKSTHGTGDDHFEAGLENLARRPVEVKAIVDIIKKDQ